MRRLAVLLAVAAGAPAAARPTAVVAGKALMPAGTFVEATVVFDGDKIVAVETAAPPAGAELIDARGRYILPGLVDTHSHLGVYSAPYVEAHADGNEATDPVTPQVRAADSVNVADPNFQRALLGGVTTVQILPGSANAIGGQTAVVKIRLGRQIEEMLFAGAPRGMKMAMGENIKRTYGGRGQAPATRMGHAAVLREAFIKARNYVAKREAWEKKPADERGAEPDRDLKLEALAAMLRGEVRAHVHCYRTDEIQTIFRIADEFDLKIASLQHALEAYRMPQEIARRGVGVATFSDLWGYKQEAYEATTEQPAILHRAGVRVSMHSDHPVIEQRWLIHEAAKAVRYGLPEPEGFRAVTLNPAWMLGIDGRVGSLEAGKDADVVVWDRHPFDIAARVERVYIDGREAYRREGR